MAIALLCSGCDRGAEAQNSKVTSEIQESEKKRTVQPVADIYPNSVEVRLFVREEFTEKNDGQGFLKPSGTLLTDQQSNQIEYALFKEPTPEMMVGCFIPHHFFRYYDINGKNIGEVEVCFCCGGVRANGESNIELGPAQILSFDFVKMKKLVESLNAPTDINCP